LGDSEKGGERQEIHDGGRGSGNLNATPTPVTKKEAKSITGEPYAGWGEIRESSPSISTFKKGSSKRG